MGFACGSIVGDLDGGYLQVFRASMEDISRIPVVHIQDILPVNNLYISGNLVRHRPA
jgi:hypothetical protein